MHKNGVYIDGKKTQTANAALQAITEQRNIFALRAVDAATLGQGCIGDIINHLGPLVELADPAHVRPDGLRYRLTVVHNLALLTLQFAERMDGLMNKSVTEYEAEVEAIREGAK